MKLFGRVDANHREIVKALRDAGCSVKSLGSVGGGCPDLLVGRLGKNYLLECKSGPKGKFTTDQQAFQVIWRGQWARVNNSIEALEVVGVL